MNTQQLRDTIALDKALRRERIKTNLGLTLGFLSLVGLIALGLVWACVQ